jgi:Secretion system C-terminal sorting domain
LKQFFYILIFIIGLNFTSSAQNGTSPSGEDGAAKLIKLYPIPATTVINFDFVSGYDKSYQFEVYNFTAKKVYELKNLPPRITLTLNDFTRGFYYYQLRDKNGRLIETQRFLVIK